MDQLKKTQEVELAGQLHQVLVCISHLCCSSSFSLPAPRYLWLTLPHRLFLSPTLILCDQSWQQILCRHLMSCFSRLLMSCFS